MGIVIVLLFWAFAGCIGAAVAAVALSGFTGFLTRGCGGRGKIITQSVTYPFLSLCWVVLIFVVYAIVNVGFLDRDPGLGDSWECPLPNGYRLLMIDVTDHGTVYNPKMQTLGGVSSREDAVFGVRTLQVSGQYIFGGVDKTAFGGLGPDTTRIDSYFVLDTSTNKRLEVADYGSLVAEAEKRGIKLELEPFSRVYGRYRFSWFEVVAGILFLLPPVWAFVALMRRTLKMRRDGRTPKIALQPS
jgi:hypothetical protein